MIEFEIYIQDGLYTSGKNEYYHLMKLIKEYGTIYSKQIPKKSIKYLKKISFELSSVQNLVIGIEPYNDIPVLHLMFPIKDLAINEGNKEKILSAIHSSILEAAKDFNWDSEIFNTAYNKSLL